MTECGDTAGALQLVQGTSERSGENGKYLLAVGRQYALLNEIEDAKKYVKRAINANSSIKAELLYDPAFDPVRDSFWEEESLITQFSFGNIIKFTSITYHPLKIIKNNRHQFLIIILIKPYCPPIIYFKKSASPPKVFQTLHLVCPTEIFIN